jgi:hypothetical protein
MLLDLLCYKWHSMSQMLVIPHRFKKIGVHNFVVRRIFFTFYWSLGLKRLRNTDVVHKFLGHLAADETATARFQQDSATCCAAPASVRRSKPFRKTMTHTLTGLPHRQNRFCGAVLQTTPTARAHAVWMT